MVDQSSGSQSTGGSGLQPNVASLLCYVCTFITGIIFLVLEKDNRQIKFHAWQAILLGAASIVVQFGLSILSLLLGYLSGVLSMLIGFLGFVIWAVFFVCWILCMVKAYQNEQWKIPYLGDIAEKQAAK